VSQAEGIVIDALSNLGVRLSPEQAALIAKGVVALVESVTQAQLRKAEAAGVAAAAGVTTVEQANEVLKAAAAAQEQK
jgi:hypothetical protein